jgi:hypothetical protein
MQRLLIRGAAIKIEYVYYAGFGLLLLIAGTAFGRSLIERCYYAVDKKYFDLMALSKSSKVTKAEQLKYRLCAWMLMAGLLLPIIVLFGVVYFSRFQNKGWI